jgi:hypothetical protein
MNKIKSMLLILWLTLLFAYNSNAQSVQILGRKVISTQTTDCDMHWAKLLFDDHNQVLISMRTLLYLNNNLLETGGYRGFLGGFVKNNQFYVAINDMNTIDIYSVLGSLELIRDIHPIKFGSSINYEKIITMPENNNSYYLLGEYYILPFNPVEHIRTQMLVGGHGVYYIKPILAEIQNDKMIRYIKLPYGGKIDESYIVEEAIAGSDSIHFFGFRNIDVPFIGNQGPDRLVRSGVDGYVQKIYNYGGGDYYLDRDITQSVILYYSDYNLKEERNVRKHKLYENTPGYDEKTDTYCDYGVLSADTKDNDVFAVFTWVEQKHFKQGSKFRQGFNINNVNSSIYYWQCSDKSYGKAEKIAEGFCPLVKVDQFGLVHVFWLDRSGNVVQKVKSNGKWRNEEIILSSISTKSIIYTKGCLIADEDRPEAILYTKFFTAEFDRDNNLHAVYPADDGIIYTKLKLE